MATGTIQLNYETSDEYFKSEGDFDISEVFQRIFTDNPAIETEFSDKIGEIFQNIDAKEISSNWANKIKKALKINTKEFDLQATMDEGLNSVLDKLNVEIPPKHASMLPKNEEAKGGGESDALVMGLMDKLEVMVSDLQESTFDVVNSSSTDENQDTVFGKVMDVNLVGISDDVVKRLVGGTGEQESTVGKQQKKKKGALGKLMDKLNIGALVTGMLGGGSVVAGGGAFLAGLAGPALLAGGLLWLAIDGIRGWMKAGEWGVSGVSGALGAALGGTDSGVSGALKGAGKGAMFGVKIGSMIGGPVGLIVGVLAGAAIGGILGWIGGEKIAKSLDSVGSSLSTWFNAHVLPAFESFMTVMKAPIDWFLNFWETTLAPDFIALKDWFQVRFGKIGKDLTAFWNDSLKPFLDDVGEFFGIIFGGIMKKATPVIKKTGAAIESIYINWIRPYFMVLGEFFDWIGNTFKAIMGKIGEVIEWGREKLTPFFGDLMETDELGSSLQTITDQQNTRNQKIIELQKKLEKAKLEKDEAEIADIEKLIGIHETGVKDLAEKYKRFSGITQTGTQDPPIKGKAVIQTPSGVRFQPHNQDKMYKMGNADVHAKPDDVLGKTFKNIDTGLEKLEVAFNKAVDVLNSHSEIFNQILAVNDQQLGIMPSLAPVAGEVKEKEIPSGGGRDPIHDYRTSIRGRM